MPEFDKLYLELYTAINDALLCLMEGRNLDAADRLMQAQVDTVGQILSEL